MCGISLTLALCRVVTLRGEKCRVLDGSGRLLATPTAAAFSVNQVDSSKGCLFCVVGGGGFGWWRRYQMRRCRFVAVVDAVNVEGAVLFEYLAGGAGADGVVPVGAVKPCCCQDHQQFTFTGEGFRIDNYG